MSAESIHNLIETLKEANRLHPTDRAKRIAHAEEQRAIFKKTVVKVAKLPKVKLSRKNKKNLDTYREQT